MKPTLSIRTSTLFSSPCDLHCIKRYHHRNLQTNCKHSDGCNNVQSTRRRRYDSSNWSPGSCNWVYHPSSKVFIPTVTINVVIMKDSNESKMGSVLFCHSVKHTTKEKRW